MIVGQEVTAAMKLQDLYYGNVIPCQHDVRKDSDYANEVWSFSRCVTGLRNVYRLTIESCSTT